MDTTFETDKESIIEINKESNIEKNQKQIWIKS